MFVMPLKTLLSLIQLRFESKAATLTFKISFQIVSGEGDCEKKLHRCETFAVNQKVIKITQELGDTTIMSKLTEGDMIATEALHHAKFLVNYYNRCRHQQLNVPGEDSNGTLAIMNGNS